MNELLARQCTQVLQEKVSRDLAMFKNYINGVAVIDLAFMSDTCHHYGIKFSRYLTYHLQIEVLKARGEDEGFKQLLELLKKE